MFLKTNLSLGVMKIVTIHSEYGIISCLLGIFLLSIFSSILKKKIYLVVTHASSPKI